MAKKLVKKKKVETERMTLPSPIGSSLWAKIMVPDTSFKEEGEYSVDLVLDPEDKEAKKYLSAIEDFAEECDRTKNLPIKPELGVDKDETGNVVVKFKSSRKPRIVDAKKEEIVDPAFRVGNGSKIRVVGTFAPYDGFGGGVTAYLQAVQVLKLVEYHDASLDLLGEEDGYTFGDSEKEEDDDCPFDADPDVAESNKEAPRSLIRKKKETKGDF